MKDLRQFFRIVPLLVVVCLLCRGGLRAETEPVRVRVRVKESLTYRGFTFPPGHWLTGTLVRLQSDTLVVDAFKGSDALAIPISRITEYQVRMSEQEAWTSVALPFGDVDDQHQAIAAERSKPGPEVEFRFFAGGVGLKGRKGWELWDSDVRYRFSTDPVRLGPGFGVACTALLARRSLFLTHDFQFYQADHRMRVYDWQGPERLPFVRPGKQTKGGRFQQSSSTVGVCRSLPGGGFLRLGGGLSGFVGTHRSGWGMWGRHLLVQYGVRSERRWPWVVEFRIRQAGGSEAHYAEFSPTGYQVTVGLNLSRPQIATSHALFWNAVGGAVCWLWFLSWIAVGE